VTSDVSRLKCYASCLSSRQPSMTEANHHAPEPAGISTHLGRKAAWYAFAVTAVVAIGGVSLGRVLARQRMRPPELRPAALFSGTGDRHAGPYRAHQLRRRRWRRPSLAQVDHARRGIELTPAIDQIGLPYDAESGPLDRADLFQFVTAWRSGAGQGQDATLYALLVNALIADNGEELFGIMFDTAGREGFAVAPRTTERFYREHAPMLVPSLQLRTFAHELLHALNRDHADAVQTPEGRLTLEAPTRCISQKQQRGWSLIEQPLMELSPHTIRFFQTAAPRDVLPGPENSPFSHRRVSPTECDDARAGGSSRRHHAMGHCSAQVEESAFIP
jgi:hypothetical protein